MNGSQVIPTFHYRDAPAMLAWLRDVLGFEVHASYEDAEGGIAHAQLQFGTGMIMIGSAQGDEGFGALQAPQRDGERVASSPYLVLASDAEVEAAHARAQAAGAEIVMKLEAQSYGGLNFSVRDPEGGVWSLGSYDPWKG